MLVFGWNFVQLPSVPVHNGNVIEYSYIKVDTIPRVTKDLDQALRALRHEGMDLKAFEL